MPPLAGPVVGRPGGAGETVEIIVGVTPWDHRRGTSVSTSTVSRQTCTTSCEVVFTLRKRPGMTDDDFERDAAAVAQDLTTLKSLLEAS